MEPKRVSAAGYADQSPVVANDTPENMAKNRRIEITLVPNLDDLPPIDDALKGDAPAAPAARAAAGGAIRPTGRATVVTGAPRLRPPSMLLARFVAFAHRSARGKRLLWRVWYQFLAARYRDPRWTFMNYGYRAPDASPGARRLELERRRGQSLLHPALRLSSRAARRSRGASVLEVGCGRGGGAAYVARKLEPAPDGGGRSVAARRRALPPRFAHPASRSRSATPSGCRSSDATFDVVLNVESSHCYGRFDAFLGEVRRVLRPGGHFLYADFRPREEIAGWRASLLAAGFAIARRARSPPGRRRGAGRRRRPTSATSSPGSSTGRWRESSASSPPSTAASSTPRSAAATSATAPSC